MMRTISLKPLLVRLLYIGPLVIFSFALVVNFGGLSAINSMGIPYSYLIIVPLIIFAYQSVRNSLLGWALSMGLYMAYLLYWVVDLIVSFDAIVSKGSMRLYLLLWLMVATYLGIGVVYLMARPKRPML
jgi:hypothetical protein